MSETYEPGELFVYTNGDRWELGEVKSSNNTGTGYFCWYSTGDTAANTPARCMHKLANAGWSHIERECEVVSSTDMTDVYDYIPTSYWRFLMSCGCDFDWMDRYPPFYCPCCGRKVKTWA